MNRRLAIRTPLALSLAALTTHALAQHEHHQASPASAPQLAPAKASGKNFRLVHAAAANCVAIGQLCQAHCLRMLSTGDKSMADCARTVSQMIPLCIALTSLAAQNSPMVPQLAKVALDACKQCADACKPHVEHHGECKDCFDACQECITQCKAVI